MSPCPGEDALLRFAEGAPDPVMEQHVEACGACRAAVVMLASMHAAPPRPAAPSLLAGRFALGETLGTGGQGLVMAAHDVRLGVDVAIKLLRPDRPDSDERLDDEVRTARRIRHPNVCAVFDLGHHGDRRFITMEQVDGQPLDTWVAEADPGFDQRRDVLRQIVDGVAAAHDHDVVHRDLKPGNVMVDGAGQAKVMDFGLAIDGRARAEGGRFGTPAWWAPEQRRGEEVTARADVYALGALGDWLLPEAQGRLRRWISTCRADAPDARFADAAAARSAWPGVEAGRRRRWLIAVAVAVALALGIGGWWAARTPGPTPQAAEAFAAGHRALRDHRSHYASLAFLEAIRLDPTFVEGHLWLAYTELWRGNADQARRSIDEVLLHIERLTADDRLFALAIEAKARHTPDRAEMLLTRLLTRRPDHLPARLTLADLDFHRGRFAKAGAAFDAYITIDPGAGQAWEHLAWARFATDGPDAALAVADRWRRASDKRRAARLAAILRVATGAPDAATREAEALPTRDLLRARLLSLVAWDRGDVEHAYALQEAELREDPGRAGHIQRLQSWIALGERRFDRAAVLARAARMGMTVHAMMGLVGRAERQWTRRQSMSELRAEHIWARAVSGEPLEARDTRLTDIAGSDDIRSARYASIAIALACLTLDDGPCVEAAVGSSWPIVRTIARAHTRQRMGDPAGAAEIMREAARRTAPRHRPPLWLAAYHLARLAGDPRAAADLRAASRYRLLTPYSIVARDIARRVSRL